MKPIDIRCKGIPYGGMVWWKRIDEAARYLVHLYIAERKVFNEIACVEKDRQTLYHTFNGLALVDRDCDLAFQGTRYKDGFPLPGSKHTNLDYYVSVEAEDKNGDIIATSKREILKPLMNNGEY